MNENVNAQLYYYISKWATTGQPTRYSLKQLQQNQYYFDIFG